MAADLGESIDSLRDVQKGCVGEECEQTCMAGDAIDLRCESTIRSLLFLPTNL
jgi:hypothetical protein